MSPVPSKTDRQIKEDVERELRYESRVDDTAIGVEVKQGIVTLTGTVPTWGHRQAAERAAHRPLGVLDVANEIHVKRPGDAPTDAEIALAVRRALEWDVFVPDARIQSTVTDGVVTLEGSVENGRERLDAARAVRDLQGVKGVVNHIRVRPTRTPDAATIRGTIEDALERQIQREARRLEVVVQGGEVTLRGQVASAAERRAIVGAVWGTPGVTAVFDELQRA